MNRTTSTAIVTAAVIGVLGITAIDPAFAYGAKKGARGFGPHLTFTQMDADGDGQVTTGEFAAVRTTRFEAQDTNGDGLLSPEEMTAAAIERARARAAKHIERMLKKNDADGDGQISLAELPGQDRSEKIFKHMDADGDGVISADEFAAAREKFAERRKHRLNE